MQNQSDLFIKFLKDRPLISVRALELAINAPRGTLAQPIMGSRKIPEKYWYDLYLALTPYGFEYPEVVEL